jgi:iron complex transport system substrate-binding protein
MKRTGAGEALRESASQMDPMEGDALPLARRLTASLLIVIACLGLPYVLGSAQAQSSATGVRVVSLDLCSDWLLARSVAEPQGVVLSPLSRRHPAPWMGSARATHDGSLEQILAIRPGLVVVGEFNATMLRRRLEMMAVKTLVMRQPSTLEELDAQLRHFTAVLAAAGVPTVADMGVSGDALGSAAAPVAAPASPVRALYDRSPADDAPRLLLLGPNGYGTGPKTFEADLIRAAGWRNYLEHPGHQQLNLERLVHDPPDAVIWAAPPHAALANRFAQHRALSRAIPSDRWLRTDYWRWQCPGPWSFDLARQLQP